MEKKTIDTLRVMLCGEIEEIAKKGNLGTHENLDVLKDLVETEKNLMKIESYQREKEMTMDNGYSQRKYFIDADYQPGSYGNSYGGRNMYNDNSYRMGKVAYDMGGNSYMYYDPRYEGSMYMQNGGGYARMQSPHDMINELKKMSVETSDPATKTAITELIHKLDK